MERAQRKSSAARRMCLLDRNDARVHLHSKITLIPAGRLQRGLGHLLLKPSHDLAL
jgi:hypothetical protein